MSMKRILVGAGSVFVLAALFLFSARAAHSPRQAKPPQLSVSFAKPINKASPSGLTFPQSIAAGDLNGDGFPDIAIVGPEISYMYHTLGTGDGHFGHWSRRGGTTEAPIVVRFADVDGDGKLDAISTDGIRPFVVVAFGDGKGHLNNGESLPSGVGFGTYQVAVADLNGDGIPDILGTAFLAGNNPGRVFVLLGEGNRKFKRATHFPSGGYQVGRFAVGDLNHDGIPDLVVVNGGQQPPYGNVSVFLGIGDGTFAKGARYSVPKYQDPFSVALADFDGDGNLDMAVTEYNSDSVHIFLGKGDGTFIRGKSAFVSPVGSGLVAVADFNGDGIPDLAVLGDNVYVLLGNGDGTFQPPAKFHVPGTTAEFIVTDFNGDGKPDIATVEVGRPGGAISILLNTTPFPAEKLRH